jgi:hypothetical protein
MRLTYEDALKVAHEAVRCETSDREALEIAERAANAYHEGRTATSVFSPHVSGVAARAMGAIADADESLKGQRVSSIE